MKHKKWMVSLCCALAFASFTATASVVSQAWTSQILRYGSTGSEVKETQGRLKLVGFYHGHIDGNYGWRTYWAVRDFQYRFGMHIDGLMGTKTKSMLARATPNYTGPWTGQSTSSHAQNTSDAHGNSSHGGQSHHNAGAKSGSSHNSPASSSAKMPSVKGVSQHDIKLLARLVYGEARGEPFKGQVAVADVILHRVRSSKFPNTIPGVIYQPGAFTAASNGQMDQQPDHEAYKAVHDALMGWDPSHGALYYFNPAKTSNAYMWSRPEITKIGHHIFTK